jgi:hypothetical protein
MGRNWQAALLLALAVCGLAACGSRGPSYFLARNSGAVLLVQWQAPVNGQANGSITYDRPVGTAPDETLGVTSVPVAVSINGSQVTLAVTGLDAIFGGETLSGMLSDGNLTLTMPPNSSTGAISTGTLISSGPSSYNSAVGALRRSIGRDNAQVAAQQRQQAEQQQRASDYKAAQQAIGNLTTGFSGGLGTLASDVQQVSSDLATVQHDASQGPNGFGNADCYQLSGIVDYDVTGTLDYDVTGTFTYDLSTLTNDIATARQAISAAESALATIRADGIAAPLGASSALEGARSAITSSVAQANADITAVNQDDAQGYSVADSIATGSCSGMGPGSPLAPIQPIS